MSVLLGELNRIQNRHRPHIAYVPTEDFLCSRPLVHFDDEAKHIRAAADKLIRYVHTSVPHETSHLPVRFITAYDRYAPEGRYTSKYSPDIPTNIQCMSYYTEPSRVTIGRGHLACVSYAGGRGYPRRKHLYSDENRDIGDEIKFRSYYSRNVHPNRNEDALLLPTGFASRILLPDRRLLPYDEGRAVVFQSKLTKPIGTVPINKERPEKKPKKKTRAQEIEDAVLAESTPYSYTPPSKYEEPQDKYVAEVEPEPKQVEIANEEPPTSEATREEEEPAPEPEPEPEPRAVTPKEPTPPPVETKPRKGSKKTSIKRVEPEDDWLSSAVAETTESVTAPEEKEKVESVDIVVVPTPVTEPAATSESEPEEAKDNENVGTNESQEPETQAVQDNSIEDVEAPIVQDTPEETEIKEEEPQTELASEPIAETYVDKNEEEPSPEEEAQEEWPAAEASSNANVEDEKVLANSERVESEAILTAEETLQSHQDSQQVDEAPEDSTPEVEKPVESDEPELSQETPALEAETIESPSDIVEPVPSATQEESEQLIANEITKTADSVACQEIEDSHETKIVTETSTELDFWAETTQTTTYSVKSNNVTESLSAESITSQTNEPLIEEPVTPGDE